MGQQLVFSRAALLSTCKVSLALQSAVVGPQEVSSVQRLFCRCTYGVRGLYPSLEGGAGMCLKHNCHQEPAQAAAASGVSSS